MKPLALAALLVASLPATAAALQLHSPTIVNAGSQTTVAPGETFFISLDTNPSTGYGWTAKVSDGGVITYQGSVMQPDPQPSGGPIVVGASEHRIFVFHANRSGSATVVFTYERPWEHGTPPARTATFTINVK